MASSEINAAIQASGESTFEKAQKKAHEQIDSLFRVSLNIAITGETGSGKSSFINTFRGLKDDDEGAAKTGVTETTTKPTPYKHPTTPNVILWDLPGTGSTKFKAKKYLKDVQFDRYDFFLLISSQRFRENDIMLAKEIRKMNKQFYFIRSKIDNDIRTEEDRKGFNLETTLLKIRRDCQIHLKEFENPKVFLISSWDPSAFDFEKLVNTLWSELPQHHQYALMQAVPVTSMAILDKKVRMLNNIIWAAAIVSGGIAVAPVTGLWICVDTAIVTSFFTKCYYSFGLDDQSLNQLTERVNKLHLKSLQKPLLVEELVKNSAVKIGAAGLVETLSRLMPAAGNAATMSISFNTTCILLHHGLKELAGKAKTVLREVGLQ